MAGRGSAIAYHVYGVDENHDLQFLGQVNARGARNAITTMLGSVNQPSDAEYVAIPSKFIIAYAPQITQKVSLEPVSAESVVPDAEPVAF